MSARENSGSTDPRLLDVEFSVVSGANESLLVGCIRSVYATLENSKLRWILTATINGSLSNLSERLVDEFPGIRIIENSTPKGFAANHNVVLTRSEARYVWLLNDDLVLFPDTVARVTAFMDDAANRRVAIVSPRLVNPDGTLQPSTYSFPSMAQTIVAHSGIRDFDLTDRLLGKLAPVLRSRQGSSRFWRHDKTLIVETLRGACVAVRTDAVRDVGPMVEVSLVGAEETEWHRRLSRHGWQVVFLHDVSVLHYGSQTVGSGAREYLPEYLKGALYYFRADRPAILFRLFCVSLVGMFGARAALAWLRRDRDSLSLARRYLSVAAAGITEPKTPA